MVYSLVVNCVSIYDIPFGSTRPFGCQRLPTFAGINPHSSVRTYPPDFPFVSTPVRYREQSTTLLLPYYSEQGGGAIVSTLSKWRVHGDSHRLNPDSSIISAKTPARRIIELTRCRQTSWNFYILPSIGSYLNSA